MIVGGFAAAYHGFLRFAKDIDVFFCDAGDNLVRLQAALVDFGFQPATVPIETLGKPDAVLLGAGTVPLLFGTGRAVG